MRPTSSCIPAGTTSWSIGRCAEPVMVWLVADHAGPMHRTGSGVTAQIVAASSIARHWATDVKDPC